MKPAVIDSSSLIFSLKNKELLELLTKRFSPLLIPEAVFEEVIEAGKARGAPEIRGIEEFFAKGILKKEGRVKPTALGILEEGEAEALAVAKRERITCISDDRKAYTVGLNIGVNVLSLSAFILFLAREERISKTKVEQLLSGLVNEGYYLKPTDYIRIIEAIRSA